VARSGNITRPSRALFILVALLVVLYSAIAIGTAASNARWKPELALDLAGGTQIVLEPKPLTGGKAPNLTKSQLDVAVSVIRQRVNGSGVSESEVTTQGSGTGQTIVVSVPGHNLSEKTKNLIEQSAQLTFRPVLVTQPSAPQPTATATPTATPTPTKSGAAKKSTKKSKAAATPKATTTPSPSATNGRILPQALTKSVPKAAATSAPAATSAAASADPSASAVSDPSATTPAPSTDTTNAAATGTASDLNQITQAIGDKFTALTCTPAETAAIQAEVPDPKKPFVTCDSSGSTKFILGPVEVKGEDVKSASAGLGTNSQGFNTGTWEVDLTFNGTGQKAFSDVTARLAQLTGAQNQFAIVLDGVVVSDPGTDERIPNGTARISGGGINEASATLLASQLKFGALPVSFQVQTSETISATLGTSQLKSGLLAGLIGLILVVLYSLLQYRALGLVTIFSLGIAGAFTYGTVTLLSWTQGYRLSLAAVTGLIVAIGITADSFIVYFERVRDEVREGRPLKSAVEAGWKRARRTILISDTVSFLAALVLYILSIGSVRGFAFTLGLTTLIDVVVVFLFTKPTVTLLSRTEFFGGGHKFSGFGPEQLGRTNAPSYAGRGRVRTPDERTQSIAARRAAQLAGGSEDGYGSPPDDETDDDPGGGSGTSSGRVSAGRTTGNRRDV
jgi:preprotein translocase subunit SecD